MTARISRILAREVLDSRGFPTVQADVVLNNGLIGRASAHRGVAGAGDYRRGCRSCSSSGQRSGHIQ